jgi:hypothetical protein
MSVKSSVVFVLTVVAFLFATIPEAQSGTVDVVIPSDIAMLPFKGIDKMFSCSRYESYAPCWAKDGGRAKRDRIANDCDHADVFSYRHQFGYYCWCVKCK